MSDLNDRARIAIRSIMTEQGETVRSVAAKVGRSANWLQNRLSGITDWTIDDAATVGEMLGYDGRAFVLMILQDAKS